MKKQFLLPLSFLFIALVNTSATKAQNCEPIDQVHLKDLLVQLGYTVKDLLTTPGKEKYEIKITKDDLDVPIGLEISPSTNYIWLTVFLGAAPSDTSSMFYNLIKQNAKIQPALFYVTDKGNLMMGLPVDNRGINNALLKRYTEFIAARVTDTKSYWK